MAEVFWVKDGPPGNHRMSRAHHVPMDEEVNTTFPDEGYYHVPELEPEECRRLLHLPEEP